MPEPAEPKYRFLCSPLKGERVSLPPGESRHAARVLRLRPNDAVELFDGVGRRARGVIAEISRNEVCVDVSSEPVSAQRLRPRVHLAFAVPKAKRLDWLLEKGTELGAASLRPVIFERSIAGGKALTPDKRERWLGHCVAAAKQCGLDYLPELRDMVRLGEFLPCEGVSPVLLGDVGEASSSLATTLQNIDMQPQELSILVGPEGGLTDEEREQALAAGCLPVRLGQTTLRIETAAVALLAGVRAMTECNGG